MKTRLLAAGAVALGVPLAAAQATEISTLPLLTQTEFRQLSEDLGAALSYKALIPAETLGLPGFDIGLAISGTELKSAVLLSKAAGNASVPTVLPVPTLRATLGLPLNLDVSAMYAAIPDVKMNLVGGDLRWAVFAGSTVFPAVAVRGAMTKLQGVDQLKVDTTSVDVSISKGFLMLTPYAGVGQVWVKSTPDRTLVPTLTEEKFTQTKFFAGVNVNLGINLVFELDSTGSRQTFSIKGGLRF